MRIRKGDKVRVISGKHKGAEGEVLHVYPSEGRALVDGVNLVKKHSRSRGPRDPGGIIDKDMPMALAKLMVIGPDGEPTRVGYRTKDEGTKVRVARRGGKDID